MSNNYLITGAGFLGGALARELLARGAEFPSPSWLDATPEAALADIRKVVTGVVADLQASGEAVPVPIAERSYSREFRVRIPPEQHRRLALQATEQSVSLNRLVSAKLAAA